MKKIFLPILFLMLTSCASFLEGLTEESPPREPRNVRFASSNQIVLDDTAEYDRNSFKYAMQHCQKYNKEAIKTNETDVGNVLRPGWGWVPVYRQTFECK